MKKIYLITSLLLSSVFFYTCKESDSKNQDKVSNLISQASLLSDEEKLESFLTVNNLDAYKVYEKCVENKLDIAIISRFVRSVFLKPNRDFYEKNKMEWYESRLPLIEFALMLDYNKKEYHKTFMDIGSGNGDKLYTALCMDFKKAYGVEYEKKLNDVALVALKPMIDKKLIEAEQGDATKMTDEYYAKADFIYMYCPLILNKDEQAKLLLRLLKNMRDNTFIYEAGFVYAKEFNKLVQTSVDDNYRGYLAIKKEKGRYLYSYFISQWEELKFKP